MRKNVWHVSRRNVKGKYQKSKNINGRALNIKCSAVRLDIYLLNSITLLNCCILVVVVASAPVIL